MSNDLFRVMKELGAQGAREALPPFCAYAITTGDAATSETVGTVTTQSVTVWLDGATQDAANKVEVVLPYGTAAPAAGQLWLVLLPNFRVPGVLFLRLSQ